MGRHPQNAVHILLDDAVVGQFLFHFAVLLVQPFLFLVQLSVFGFQGGQIGELCQDWGALSHLRPGWPLPLPRTR